MFTHINPSAIILAASWENRIFAWAKTKAQIRFEADQRLCFRYTDSAKPPLLYPTFEDSSSFPGCAGLFVSDLDGNPEDLFSHDAAHIR